MGEAIYGSRGEKTAEWKAHYDLWTGNYHLQTPHRSLAPLTICLTRAPALLLHITILARQSHSQSDIPTFTHNRPDFALVVGIVPGVLAALTRLSRLTVLRGCSLRSTSRIITFGG